MEYVKKSMEIANKEDKIQLPGIISIHAYKHS